MTADRDRFYDFCIQAIKWWLSECANEGLYQGCLHFRYATFSDIQDFARGYERDVFHFASALLSIQGTNGRLNVDDLTLFCAN